METTLKYTTLKGLISKTNQFSLNNFLTNRIYHKEKGHIKIKLSDPLKLKIENLFKEFLNLHENFIFNKFTCGLFNRLIINERTLKAEYIAGQDYPSEIKYLKKLIKRGY